MLDRWGPTAGWVTNDTLPVRVHHPNGTALYDCADAAAANITRAMVLRLMPSSSSSSSAGRAAVALTPGGSHSLGYMDGPIPAATSIENVF
jgi:hypothetical protein